MGSKLAAFVGVIKRTFAYRQTASKAIVQPACWLNSLRVAHYFLFNSIL